MYPFSNNELQIKKAVDNVGSDDTFFLEFYLKLFGKIMTFNYY